MKKMLLMLLLIATSAATLYADGKVDVKKKDLYSKGPRGLDPVITTEKEGGLLTCSANFYNGLIDVYITDDSGQTVYVSTEMADGTMYTEINISTLDEGVYTINFSLDDGTEYYGMFETE